MHPSFGSSARTAARVLALGLWLGASLAAAAWAAPASTIDINGYRFDPLRAAPDIPSALQSAPTDAPALYLVQFSGPVDEAWKGHLVSLGASFYGYVPENAFIVRMDAATRDRAGSLPFVRWIGPYHIAYRISPEIGHQHFRSAERQADSLRTLSVYVAGDAFSVANQAGRLGTVVEMIDDPILPGFVIRASSTRIPALAGLSGVLWVEERPEAFALNNTTKWVIQSNQSPQVPIWDHGIYGEGQIVCEMDSGLDYNSCWFEDLNMAPPGPTHRKVIDYTLWGGVAYDGCTVGHGTHVAGTIVGDQSFINPGVYSYNGMAYKAKIMIQDVGQDNSTACTEGLLNVPSSLTAALTDAYTKGARVHTNSWGSSSNSYTGHCVNVDSFMWTHRDFLMLFANGNDGPVLGTVGSPATAKDCISVGATQQAPNQEYLANYSSRGPANDGRYKPTVDAPGGDEALLIRSANNNAGNPPNPTCALQALMGTSMATPAVAGAALLVRDYFAQGFYPMGTAGGTPVHPSAALVKAVLINSARDMDMADEPNNYEGWGRILLEDALYFDGDTRELRVEDDSLGLATGEQMSYSYQVDSGDEPLKIVLAWTDYPATAGANPALVNDLNLTVVSPAGDTYLGNVYSGGQSATGGTADAINVEECVRRDTPEVGTWVITVRARNVPQGGYQPFALATTGSFANWPADISGVGEGTPSARMVLQPARPNPFTGSTELSFELPSAGQASLRLYDAAGRRVATLAKGWLEAGLHRYQWNGRTDSGALAPAGTYFCRLEVGKNAVVRKINRLR